MLTQAALRDMARLVDNRILDLIVLPTEKCNFRCTYCYEDFSVGKMKRETVDSVKKLMTRRAAELDVLSLSWFGGEPLLAKDVVIEISTHAVRLAKEYPSLNYRAAMTTNGYLLDADTFASLGELGVRDFQISLDGVRDTHDRTRVKAGGAGTFDAIWANLLAIRGSDVPAQITLRIHLSADTASGVEPLIEEILREFRDDHRFKLFFKPIERLGGRNDESIQVLTSEGKRRVLNGLGGKLNGHGFLLPEDQPYVCYAARPNSMVIRADGRIGKCTVALNDSRNEIGALRPDGTLALNQTRIWPWLRGLATMDADTLACPLTTLPCE